MAKVRNLKYGKGEQKIVEQPIYKGTPLKKWIHNGIVVWENGNGIGSMCAQSNSGVLVFDLSGDEVMVRYFGGQAQFLSNSKMAFRISQATRIMISNDFVNWKYVTLQGKINQAAITNWGILYTVNFGTTSNPNYKLCHATIDADTLEIIDDRILIEEGSVGSLYGKNGYSIGGSTPSLTHFWWKTYFSTATTRYTLELYEYDVKKNADGKEIVVGYKRPFQKDCSPYYGSRITPEMLSNNRMILYRNMFSYGSQYFVQIIIAPFGQILDGSGFPVVRTFGSWLDEQAAKEATESKPFEVRRAEIKKQVQDAYPNTMEDESVSIQAFSSAPFEPWQMGIGDKIPETFDPNDINFNYYRAQSSSTSQIVSGFLGTETWIDEDGDKHEKLITNILFPLYSYNSTSKIVEKTATNINVYDGQNDSKVGSYDYVMNATLPLHQYAVRYDDGTISYDGSPYYCKYFSTSYIVFRHKKDMKKNFAISIGSLSNWTKLDIPKEWFS